MADFINWLLISCLQATLLLFFGRPGGLYAPIFFAGRQAKKDARSNP